MSTKTRLKKLQKLLEAKGFTIRYEKGQFESGACLVNDRKVIIVNKFIPDDAKLEALQLIVKDMSPELFFEKSME
jgi:hypothetical protein